MTSSNSHPLRLTRRRALVGAAWSAPVIVAVTAVPALAASPTTTLDLQRGSSAAVLTSDGTDNYYDLQFAGLSVVVPGAGVGAGALSLTITYTPTTPGGPASMLVVDEPSGWTISPVVGQNGLTVTITYGGAAAGGTEVQVPNGFFVGAGQSTATQTGTYVVTAAAAGFTSDQESFATGTARAARTGHAIPRRVV